MFEYFKTKVRIRMQFFIPNGSLKSLFPKLKWPTSCHLTFEKLSAGSLPRVPMWILWAAPITIAKKWISLKRIIRTRWILFRFDENIYAGQNCGSLWPHISHTNLSIISSVITPRPTSYDQIIAVPVWPIQKSWRRPKTRHRRSTGHSNRQLHVHDNRERKKYI